MSWGKADVAGLVSWHDGEGDSASSSAAAWCCRAGHLHRWVCGAGHTQPGGNVWYNVSRCALLPCSLCPVCQCTECFSSAVKASKLPAPKALVILQLVTRSFHRPGFPRTLKSVSSDTRDSLDPSMLNLKLRFYASCCPLLMCSSALVVLEGASVSDLTIAAATLAFCLSLQVARILKSVLVV